MALAAIILIGGGRRLHWAWRARKAVARLSDPRVTAVEVEAVAEFGRSGVWELLRIFSTSESEPMTLAAGRALARLWKHDELVAEEEQALVRRGLAVTWKARRRYPRSLTAAIPISVRYDIPFLPDEGDTVHNADLEWSHRIVGARRAGLEEFSTWKAGRGDVAFSVVPDDFPTNGPHRLVLQTRVRTLGLSGGWELELPHVPFQFDFDPVLRLDAILTLSDAVRDEAIGRGIRLESATVQAGDVPANMPMGREWVLRNPPRLAVDTPLPSDLAHRLSVEFEGTPGRFPAGSIVLSGQGPLPRGDESRSSEVRRIDVGPFAMIPDGIITRPGVLRLRLHLEADSQLGWADPDVRSVWPGQIATNWVDAEIIRH
jgi:hypothetical protein